MNNGKLSIDTDQMNGNEFEDHRTRVGKFLLFILNKNCNIKELP